MSLFGAVQDSSKSKVNWMAGFMLPLHVGAWCSHQPGLMDIDCKVKIVYCVLCTVSLRVARYSGLGSIVMT